MNDTLFSSGASIVRLADMFDVCYLAEHLRQQDIDEIKAASGLTPYEALKNGLVYSKECLTLEHEGIPYAMTGLGDRNTEVDASGIWCLGTDQIPRLKKYFNAHARQVVDLFHQTDSRLYNYVDCRNQVAIDWLANLGAVFSPPEDYGVDQKPFMKFILQKKEVHYG